MIELNQKLLRAAKWEREFYADDCIVAWQALEEAKKAGNENEIKRITAEWESASFWVERYEGDIERIEQGETTRGDYRGLSHVANAFNTKFGGPAYGMLPPTYTEDYGIDMAVTGITPMGDFFFEEYEVKSVRNEKYDRDYFRKVAGRNRFCRYCDSGSSQEEISFDTTPMPDYLRSDMPIHVLNDTDYYGNTENAKINRLLRRNAGLILVLRDRMLIYSPVALKRAVKGRIWILCTHTTDYGDRERRWERKAVIDMSAYSSVIRVETPPNLL